MFSLSVISDEVSQDLQRVIDICNDFDVSMIEPRSVWDTEPQDLSQQQISKMKQMLDDNGFEVPCIAAPFFKCDIGDPQQYEEHIEILHNCIALAHQLDCDIIRGFTFWKTGPAEAVWQQLLDAYEEPIEICEREDVMIGIENEASTHIATAAEAVQMYQDLGSDRVQAIWDPANEVFAEGGELPYPDAFERMKPYMIHMHIKDAVKDPQEEAGARCVPVGDGGYIDYPAQFNALDEMGYDGACSLETHWRPETQLDEESMNEPGGASFSAGGEKASRICFENIVEILNIEGLRQ